MLDPTLKSQLATYLDRLTATVELAAALDDSPAAAALRTLLAEIASLSGRIRLVEHADGEVRRPSFSIATAGAAAGIAAYIAETIVPDESPAPAPSTRGVWAEALRRTRQVSAGNALRAAPATVVAFLAFEFAGAS